MGSNRISRVLMLFLALVLVLTSCLPVLAEGGEAPLYPLETDVKLTYWNEMNPNVSANYVNMGDTPFAAEFTARTGVEIEYIHSTTDEAFALMIASRDYPDIVEFWWDAYPGGPMKAVQDGVIIPVSTVMPDSAPAFAAFLEANPALAAQISWEDGTIIGFPSINGDREFFVEPQGRLIRLDLLEAYGLEIPVTIDDWYLTLTTFKENGIAAPFSASQGYKSEFISTAYGIKFGMYLEDGQVVFGPTQPQYKDFLETWTQWYQEGLLDADIATVDSALARAKMLDGSAAVTIGYVSNLLTYNQAGAESIQGYSVTGTPLPMLNAETPNTYFLTYNSYEPADTQAVITTACEHPEIAALYLDYLWSDEGNLLANWGVEGITFEYNEEGNPAYTEYVLANPNGWSASQVRAGYSRAYASGPYRQDTRRSSQNYTMPLQLEIEQLWKEGATSEHLIPPVRRTVEEDERYTSIMTEVNTFWEEALLQFMLGNRSLDTYDNYLEEIRSLGIEEAIAIQQAAYDRYMAK